MYSSGDIGITPVNPAQYVITADSTLITVALPTADGTTTSDYVDAAQLVKSQGF